MTLELLPIKSRNRPVTERALRLRERTHRQRSHRRQGGPSEALGECIRELYLVDRHGIPKCTLSRILKDGDKIEKAYNSGAFAPGKKRMRLADHEGLKKGLFPWFKRAQSSNLPVNGPILEEKARDIALQIQRQLAKPFQEAMMLCMNRNKGYTLDLLPAIHISAQSWDEVAPTTIQRCFGHAGFSKKVATDQEESDADSAEAHAVFGLVAEVCGTGTVTMDDNEDVDDDVVTCREDTFADLLRKVEDGTGDESEEEIDNDVHQSTPPSTTEASHAVEVLQRYFQIEGCLELVCSPNKMNAYYVKQCHAKLKQTTLHSFFWSCDP
ncbi:hypothetical protein HPB47_006620 [Ixodes persulcatus]|uniref:Uncharacterized protein n=1 Tax=Ixodes persulcatus TaxID=34615 RepID=A0AC60P9Y4_IXOPE|nr:hypothetical protein HPB47_006620 [Ixodes persulcatus]